MLYLGMGKKQPGRPRRPLPGDIFGVLARNVIRLREKQKLTPEDAADKCGCDRATWYRIESADIDPPLSRLEAVAKVLRVKISELLRNR